MREGEGCHVSSSQWTFKQSTSQKLVKSGRKVKDWSKKRSFLQILIFLDVSAKLDCRIENGLF